MMQSGKYRDEFYESEWETWDNEDQRDFTPTGYGSWLHSKEVEILK